MSSQVKKCAVISNCGAYRYRLTRKWASGPQCLFIMLNPSTADGYKNDATIRRCIGFAKREGCGSLAVVNLMAFRATDPKSLPSDKHEAFGPQNLFFIKSAIVEATGPIIAAWGSHPRAQQYSKEVLRMLRSMKRPIYALKLTKDHAPSHPLYIKANAPLVPYDRETEGKRTVS